MSIAAKYKNFIPGLANEVTLVGHEKFFVKIV